MLEEWRPIKGYERYEISNQGRVRHSRTGKIRKLGTVKCGYSMIGLRELGTSKMKNLSIHRLVAIAFIPNPENKKCVNHKDGDKSNNCVDNLEWCTHSENTKHSFRNGLQIHPQLGKYGWNSFNGRPIKQIDLISGKVIKEYGSICDAARHVGVHNENIRACANGITSQCGGYKWEYSRKVGE